ncbi:DUF4190 domain-containing protein [Marinactinospora rubrisoli]|uniref:DUF4190 domain-containing protein n=1 Tax=Marinactinospora rubrisoli TaxID=2715399 RepID=A0ABW2KHG9_9ACTN
MTENGGVPYGSPEDGSEQPEHAPGSWFTPSGDRYRAQARHEEPNGDERRSQDGPGAAPGGDRPDGPAPLADSSNPYLRRHGEAAAPATGGYPGLGYGDAARRPGMAEPYPSALGGLGTPAPGGDTGYPGSPAARRDRPGGHDDPLGDGYRPAREPEETASGWPERPYGGEPLRAGGYPGSGGYPHGESDTGGDPLADGYPRAGAASPRTDAGRPADETDDWGGYRNDAGRPSGGSGFGEPLPPDPALDRPAPGAAGDGRPGTDWSTAPGGERSGDPLGGSPSGGPGVYRVPTGEQPAASSLGASGTGYPGWDGGTADRADVGVPGADPLGSGRYSGVEPSERAERDPLRDPLTDPFPGPVGSPGSGQWEPRRETGGATAPDPLSADTAWPPRSEDRGTAPADADPLDAPSRGAVPRYGDADPLGTPYRTPGTADRSDVDVPGADPLGSGRYPGVEPSVERAERDPLADPLRDPLTDPFPGPVGSGQWEPRRETGGATAPDPLSADTAWPPRGDTPEAEPAAHRRPDADPLGAEPRTGGRRSPSGAAPSDELGPLDWRDPAPTDAGPDRPAARADDPLADPYDSTAWQQPADPRPQPEPAVDPLSGGLGTGSGNTWAFSRDDPRLPEEVRRIGAEAQDRRRDGNPTHTTQALRPKDLQAGLGSPPASAEDRRAEPSRPDPGEGTQAMPVLDDRFDARPAAYERGYSRDDEGGFGHDELGPREHGYGDRPYDRPYDDGPGDDPAYRDHGSDRGGYDGHPGRPDEYGAPDGYRDDGYRDAEYREDRYRDDDYRDDEDHRDDRYGDDAPGDSGAGARGRRSRGGRDRVAEEFPGFDDRPAGEEYPGYDNLEDWPETAPRAGATLWLGILGLIPVIGLATAIAALVIAPGVRRAIRSSHGELEGEHLVRGGVITAWIGIGLSGLEIIVVGTSLLF